MKIFRVVYERDGETQREPNGTSTEIVRRELRYAAGTIQEAWDASVFLRDDEEITVIAIIEEHSGVVVLQKEG